MKTLIIYNHPYEGSYNHAILESVVKGITRAQGKYEVIDLDKENFHPVMTSADLLGFVKHQAVDPIAISYAEKIKEADHLVFIFPIWWEMMPALTKGFIDKVIYPGLTYDYKENGISMVSLLPKLKATTVITTMNTPKIMYKLTYGNALKKALIKGTFKKSGMKNVNWISLNMVKMSKVEKRQKWLKNIEQKFANM
ncbi:NAD(P)H-dependent oxidoreductase [Enterococcus durans]|uniref:NAD(P)H-dependent oxidoreductase n=1 Tax=Enterococcus durans TaxID=53345 RepID=UPI00232EA762|nr:NAD(P)H-dependent oxidoreductase [Enterococcus durans]MDB1652956.1 NAD(P)H-dependent oxidoreductase [Enterococcus durans]MDB1656653.1 NAD(P)H-dependent oxidoreductase [Enterococcus durans]MDB1663326.1 NAD(P)H-dependent oxidoreductase [Enterococcus durans]MDB1667750.1 NAD(P)H-dependent oxidoreductase [Enterococcus durans]MDB1671084.1 NAD(P)H-dependent oxidoreductase [Enterococcus durans]